MKISVFFYSALAFVIISGVMFGLDWQPASLSPMAPIQVVALPPPPPPPAPAPVVAPVVAPKPAAPSASPSAATTSPATNPAAPKIAAPSSGVPSPAAPSPVAPISSAPAPAAPVAVAPAAPPAEPTPPKALCDIAACTSAYHSFTPSDCTYLSSRGRKLCTKGVVPAEAATPAAPAAPALSDAQPSIMQDEPGRQTPPAAQPNTESNIKCNVGACATAYRTFTASDCTFMGSGGVRKLCTK